MKPGRGVRSTLALLVGLTLAALWGYGCPPGGPGKGPTRDSVQDPLVRERVMARMEEIYAPAKKTAEEVHQLEAHKECGGICTKSASICDAARRLCDLAADYPASDDEVQERCTWSSTDCDASRSSCAACGGPKKEEVE